MSQPIDAHWRDLDDETPTRPVKQPRRQLFQAFGAFCATAGGVLVGGWALPRFGWLGATTQADAARIDATIRQEELAHEQAAIGAEAQLIGQTITTQGHVTLAQAEATAAVLATVYVSTVQPVNDLFGQVSAVQIHAALQKVLAGESLTAADVGAVELLDRTIQTLPESVPVAHPTDPGTYLKALTATVNELQTGAFS